MAKHSKLTPETFFAAAEMIHGHLRTKEADRWSPAVCRLKWHSFTSEFPEVSEAQFLWAAEQWVQSLGQGFTRFPTWKELMAVLYRTQNGVANRSWGFKPGLPPFLAPSPWQQELLPPPTSLPASPDPINADAYVPFQATSLPLLPPQQISGGLSDEQWQQYLNQLNPDGADHQPSGSAADPGERIAEREVVNQRLQPTSLGRTRAAKPGVSG